MSAKKRKSPIDKYRQFFALFGTGERLTSKEADILDFIFWIRAISALERYNYSLQREDIQSLHKHYLDFIRSI